MTAAATTVRRPRFLGRPGLALTVLAVLAALLPGLAPAQAAAPPAAPYEVTLLGGARAIGVELLPPDGGETMTYQVKVGRGPWQPLEVTETETGLFGRVTTWKPRKTLRDGTSYAVSVAAVADGVRGTASAPETIRTLPVPVPEYADLVAEDGAVRFISGKLRPKDPVAVGRRVVVTRVGDAQPTRVQDCLEEQCTIGGLTNGERYHLTATPYNANVLNGVQERVYGKPRSTRTPFTPVEARRDPQVLTALGHDHRVVMNVQPPEKGIGSTLEGRSWEVAVGDGEFRPTARATELPNSNLVEIEVEDLDNGEPVSIRVRAVTEEGASPASEAVSATPATTPGAVRDLAAEVVGRQVRLTWKAPLDDGGAALTKYLVLDQAENLVCISKVVDAPACVTKRLRRGATFTFVVHAVNGSLLQPDTGAGPGVSTEPVTIR